MGDFSPCPTKTKNILQTQEATKVTKLESRERDRNRGGNRD